MVQSISAQEGRENAEISCAIEQAKREMLSSLPLAKPVSVLEINVTGRRQHKVEIILRYFIQQLILCQIL